MRGIYSPLYYRRSIEYVWSTMSDAFPRHIGPTDFDWLVEVNHCFALFEFKTVGAAVMPGQGLAFRRLMESLPAARAVAVLAEHERLDRVDVRADIASVQIGWVDASKKLTWERRRFTELSSMWHICNRFARDADTFGDLKCADWFADIAASAASYAPMEENR